MQNRTISCTILAQGVWPGKYGEAHVSIKTYLPRGAPRGGREGGGGGAAPLMANLTFFPLPATSSNLTHHVRHLPYPTGAEMRLGMLARFSLCFFLLWAS